MRHDLSKIFAVGICAACLEEEVTKEHSDDYIAEYCKIVLSTVFDVACIERRFHKWCLLCEIIGEDDIRHEQLERSFCK